MFNNIGGKIKGLAKVITWLGILASLVAGVIVIQSGNVVNRYYGTNEPMVLQGIAVMVLGSLASWIGSFLIYGFGELIDHAAEIAHNTRKQDGEDKAETPLPSINGKGAKDKEVTWRCPSCKTDNSLISRTCKTCGRDRYQKL